MENKETPSPKLKGEGSLIGTMATLGLVLMLLFCVLSVINTIFGLNIEVNGAALPRHWDATIGLIGAAVIWGLFWFLLTYVGPIRRFGQRSPWITTLLILGSITAAIVVITIVDNQNRAERNREWEIQDSLNIEKMIHEQDSLKELELERDLENNSEGN